MDEIRFSQMNKPAFQKGINEDRKEPKVKGKSLLRKILLILLIILLAVAALLLLYSLRVKYISTGPAADLSDPNASSYYAIFLSGGQIYFGQIAENNESEIVIANSYRLQSNGQTYTLLKTTDEAYGSTDKMFINRSQILYYEQLKKDSKVVELINQQK